MMSMSMRKKITNTMMMKMAQIKNKINLTLLSKTKRIFRVPNKQQCRREGRKIVGHQQQIELLLENQKFDRLTLKMLN